MNSNIDIAKRIASSLDCTLSKEVLKTFSEILVPEKYKKGERILDEGQVCEYLYFIDKGMTAPILLQIRQGSHRTYWL